MAGTAWKATGVVLLVIGATLALLGLGGAVYGGVTFNDAMSDGSKCGESPFSTCNGDVLEARVEAAGVAAIAGAIALAVGVALGIAGIVLLYVGRSRERRFATGTPPA